MGNALSISDQNVFRVVSDIRRDHSPSELPILALESYKNKSTAIKLLKYGVNDFALQSTDPEELIIRLRQNIDHASAYQKIQRISRMDDLTDVYNRNYFFELIHEQIKQIKPQHTTFVMMADLDRFKNINDTYGHLVGDQAIRYTAKKLNRVFKNFTVSRYGGEEFCVYGQITSMDHIQHLAKFFKSEIEMHSKAQAGVHFTISLGICYCQQAENIDIDTLLAGADFALYQAKAAGRNQIVAKEI
jgi:diguanylate cyclase (GGDEF)-like protein